MSNLVPIKEEEINDESLNSATKLNRSSNKTSDKNYILRDLTLWIVFIVFLPIILFSFYSFTKSQNLKDLSKTQTKSDYAVNIGHRRLMHRIMLDSYEESLCMDGSVASYYFRPSSSIKNSKKWLIFLEGGHFCYNTETCLQRSLNSFNLTSSLSNNRNLKYGKGILSDIELQNKYFHDFNTVSLPYCSSDLWIGKKKCENCTDGYTFMGSQILNDVLDDLLINYSMNKAELILFDGESAGGVGLLMNSNRIQKKLTKKAPNSVVKSIVDSSWLLDLPFSYLCHDPEDSNECILNRLFSDAIR
jgi:hypothetical protein